MNVIFLIFSMFLELLGGCSVISKIRVSVSTITKVISFHFLIPSCFIQVLGFGSKKLSYLSLCVIANWNLPYLVF